MIRKISPNLLDTVIWNKLLPVYIDNNSYLVTEYSIKSKAKKLHIIYTNIMKMIKDMKKYDLLKPFITYFENINFIGEIPNELNDYILYDNDMFLFHTKSDIIHTLSLFCNKLTTLSVEYCKNIITLLYSSKNINIDPDDIYAEYSNLKEQRLGYIIQQGRNLDNRLNTKKFYKEMKEIGNNKNLIAAYANKNNLL